jgi:rubredoxin
MERTPFTKIILKAEEERFEVYNNGWNDGREDLKKQGNQINPGTTWVLEENVLYSCTCPKCGYRMFMSQESLLKRLKKWGLMLKEIIK